MWLLDTSALLKICFNEKGGDDLDAFLVGRADLAVSRLALLEATAATKKAHRDGRLSDQQAVLMNEGWDAARLKDLLVLPLHDEIVSATVELVRALGPLPLRAADALHIQTALNARAECFVTADRQQAQAARFVGLDTIGADPA
jgi:uncharacterized protein